jgi:hypothetical protein
MNTNDIIATIGVALILIAYFTNTYNLIEKDGRLYFAMNIVGAGLAGFASYLISFWPFVILEGIWVVVSVIAFFKVKSPISS